MSDGLTAISFPEANLTIARFALRQLPVFWWQEAGVSLRMWLMKNSVKIVKLFLSPSSTPNQSLTETMGKEEEEKERDSTAKNSCRSVKEAPPQLTFCGVGAGRLRFTCAI